MSRRVGVNPGEMFMVADRMILVREYESILGMTGKIGVYGSDRLAYMFTFVGRVNNSTKVDEVTVAMSPEDAAQFMEEILKGLELLAKLLKDGE